MWYLEVTKPLYAVKVALVRASTHALELSWTATTFAAAYVLQIQKIEQAPAVANTKQTQAQGQTLAQQPATTANGAEGAPLVASAALKFEKNPISVLHLTGANSPTAAAAAASVSASASPVAPSAGTATTATIAAVGKPAQSSTVFVTQSQVKAATGSSGVSAAADAVVAPSIVAVQQQPQLSIISSTATGVSPTTGGANGGIIQKFRPSASIVKTSASQANQDGQSVAVRVGAHSVTAPSGGVVLTTSQSSSGGLRIIPGISTGTGVSAGQSLRLATYGSSASAAGGSSSTTTILKASQPNAAVQTSSPAVATTTTSLGGKQYFIQKPLTLAPNVQLQFVKTSCGGMTVQTLPKVNFNIAKSSGGAQAQAISISNQQLSAGSAPIQARQQYIYIYIYYTHM